MNVLQAFLPPPKYESKDQVSEEILVSTMRKGQVSDALHVYKLLDKDVSKATKQSLLEIMCYTNGYDSVPEEFTEERSYQVDQEITRNIWMSVNRIFLARTTIVFILILL